MLAALYFAQGLPFGLITRALPAIARDAGLPLQYIGLLSLAALPWALKFVWAPWVDRLGRGHSNHRKRWIITCQLAAVAVLAAMSLLPMRELTVPLFAVLLILLFFLNLSFATHDIATDGLAVRLLPAPLRGIGNSVQTGGYKVGLLTGGAVLLGLVGQIGWMPTVWLAIAALLLLLIPLSRYPEPEEPVAAPISYSWRWWTAELWRFWGRSGMGWWLVLLLIYKVGDSFGTRMIKPFLVDQNWTLSQLAVLDLTASLAGLAAVAMAGLLLMKLSRLAALVSFAVLQAGAFFGWAWLAQNPHSSLVWTMAIAEQCADGLATVALFTVMMDNCRAGHEGSDYTVQASVMLMAAGLFTLFSGFSAAYFGYSLHFTLAAALALAAIIPALFWSRAGQVKDDR
ncbi:MAG: MFS transporter [Alcanivoracaceae bacterium]|nr:MFS transporter [Alcanivoracaceae bacterium]